MVKLNNTALSDSQMWEQPYSVSEFYYSCKWQSSITHNQVKSLQDIPVTYSAHYKMFLWVHNVSYFVKEPWETQWAQA